MHKIARKNALKSSSAGILVELTANHGRAKSKEGKGEKEGRKSELREGPHTVTDAAVYSCVLCESVVYDLSRVVVMVD